MLRRLRDYLRTNVFSNDRDLEARLISVVYLLAIAAALAWLLARPFTANAPALWFVGVAIIGMSLLVIYIGNKYKHYTLISYVILILMGDVIFPFAFINMGGVDSGMAAFFALTLILTFILMPGKHFWILCAINSVVVIACYYVVFKHPALVSTIYITNEGVKYRDRVINLLIEAFCVGTFIRFQRGLFEGEHKKLTSITDKLLTNTITMSAINKAAIEMSRSDAANLEETLTLGFDEVARAADIHVVTIWRNIMRDGEMYANCVFAYKFGAGAQPIPTAVEYVKFSQYVPRWLEVLSRSNVVNSPVSELPGDEAAQLHEYGVKSVVMIPVFHEHSYWGGVMFEDKKQVRTFSDDIIELMKSVSFLAANVFFRADLNNTMLEAEGRSRAMVHASPIGTVIYGADLVPADCNDSQVRLLGVPDKAYYLSHYKQFRPEFQPDGSDSTKKVEELQMAVITSGDPVRLEWIYISAHGELVPTEVTFARIKYRGTYAVVAYTYDLRSINLMAESLQKQDRLLRTINDATATLLNAGSETFSRDIWDCLSMMGDCVQADRISIWHSNTEDDRWLLRFGFEWAKGAVPEQYAGFAATLNINEEAPEWGIFFSRGACVSGRVREMPKRSRDILEPQGTLAALLVPVIIRGEFWGVVNFENTHSDRAFTDQETSILRSASLLIANALQRNASANLLRERLEQQELMSDISQGFLVKGSAERHIDAALAKLGRYLGAQRVIIATADEDDDYCVDIYRWYSAAQYEIPVVNRGFNTFIMDTFPAELRAGANTPVKTCADVEHSDLVDHQVLSSIGTTAFAWAPLYVNGRYFALLAVECCNGQRLWSEGDERIISAIASSISGKLAQNFFEKELRVRLEHQYLLSEITQSFVGKGGEDALIKDALEKLGRHMNVSRATVISHETLGVVDGWFQDTTFAYDSVSSRLMGLMCETFPAELLTGIATPALSCNDTRTVASGMFAPFESIGTHAFIWAPLYIEGLLWGILSVENCGARRWVESDVRTVGMIASSIAGLITREIFEKERQEALERAISASHAKGDFLSNMSHEMRTPMNAIIGMTAIGKASGDIERKNYAFSKIEDASTHLLGVINDVLDMSKIEANKLELSSAEFDFEKMLIKVVNVINFRVEEKNQRFFVNVDPNIPRTIIADDQRLAQVITNLLSNAVKFTPEGGDIRLDATLTREAESLAGSRRVEIKISITDSGIGISKEQQAKLFQSFQQAETHTARKYGGTGLGLAISKRIIEMMDGTVWIESELNKGSSFIFTILADRGKEVYKSLLSPGVSWHNLRMLAVDDEDEICQFFQMVSEEFGIQCDVAADGDRALELILGGTEYDLYFIDWRMPVMNGIELARKIQEVATHKRHVITMISAAEWSSIEVEAKEAGVNKFLPKPLLISTIADCINECLGIEGGEEKSAEVERDTFAGFRLLIAEDVEINREIVGAMMEAVEIEVDFAENGRQALNQFSDNPDRYSMIFMDVQMPEMDGYEATRLIRASGRQRAKTIPIVAMTANVFREDIEHCLDAGMNDHVGKPLNMEDVMSKLRHYLTGAPLSPPAAPVRSEDLATGDELIDDEHKQIFKLSADLVEVCGGGADARSVADTIGFLKQYVRNHFSNEEKFAVEIGFPGAEAHKRLHDRLALDLDELIADFDDTKDANIIINRFNSFINTWLHDHIRREDKKIAEWSRRRG